MIEQFSLFILRLAWFQTSKLLLRSPVSLVIQTDELLCSLTAVPLVGGATANQSFVSRNKNEKVMFSVPGPEKWEIDTKMATSMNEIDAAMLVITEITILKSACLWT